MKCTFCNEKAVYNVKYNGTALCREHFINFFEKRVKREIRNQTDLKRDKITISVAISGGKDSLVTLYVLNKILSDRRNLKIKAFTVDEGISGYRPSGIEKAARLCKSLGIDHEIISFKREFGYTLDEIMSIDNTRISCSHCGPMRRSLMNKISMYNKADYLALGINLDDYAQSILMNVVRGDISRYIRLAPHTGIERDGLIPRIIPLRKIPEKEVVIYAILNNIDYDNSWCPYYRDAYRNEARMIINMLEEKTPGTRQAIVKFFDGTRDILKNSYESKDMKRCMICGSPSQNDVCEVCSDLKEINERVLKKSI
ncbi:TIGR00269 family protein [Picrophilus oshimae]|uniref:TIGR00269 family protein n=1 Tax=Picrophilus torridus (strain ATCC 700027 / DSM 9790 / JCM 10055 / NBRC 100828 / KAW 2/3) TaxID=1122961 RepID=A0A8G2L7Y8_PICTO|nr:TIGR00269 family protein [Picrophilus oshimae]SMD31525.1 TIGR00269 family protein [Picrophilus oshimae DSM 9789]